ncbi:MAG: hypothetical protein KF680_06255 [Cryobacterium sp.]|nr:hypothetical protein [Cryobacterium sp.]
MSQAPELSQLAELIPVLGVALRTRAQTPAELARIVGQPEDGVRSQLEQLESLGFVSVTNDVITYRRPEAAVAGIAEGVADVLGRTVTGALAGLQGAFGAVPGMLDAWAEGNADAALHTDVLHGPWAAADMWRLQFTRRVPEVSDVCMPDTTALFSSQDEYLASFWAARAGQDIKVRLLMSVSDATHPLARERIQGELDSGVRIRMHPNLPSFFWITDSDTVGFPLIWGQHWPTSVMAVQSSAFAAVMSWMYERLWSEAVPVDRTEDPWNPMLTLMGKGMTMNAAASALGIAPRTGRRRVEAAMAHYGAISQFSLGAAWAQAQTGAGAEPSSTS